MKKIKSQPLNSRPAFLEVLKVFPIVKNFLNGGLLIFDNLQQEAKSGNARTLAIFPNALILERLEKFTKRIGTNMNKKTWKKITDPEKWPELKKAKWSKNIFAPSVLDSNIKRGTNKLPVCFDLLTNEYFIFC